MAFLTRKRSMSAKDSPSHTRAKRSKGGNQISLETEEREVFHTRVGREDKEEGGERSPSTSLSRSTGRRRV